jgi:hypothetical protein
MIVHRASSRIARVAALAEIGVLLATGALISCSSPQGSTGVGNPLTAQEQLLLDDGDEVRDAGDTASAIVSVPLLAIAKVDALASPDLAATTSTFSTDAFFPAKCHTATRNGNAVTFALAGCTAGPLGLAGLTGSLTATFAAGAGGSVDIAIAGGADLTLDGVPVTQSATANVVFTTDGKQRTVDWKGTYESTTPKGKHVKHEAAYVFSNDSSGCVALDGTSTNTIGAREMSVTIAGYQRCGRRNMCPSAGKLTFTDLKTSTTMSLTFLGGASAVVTRNDGSQLDVGLRCTP